MPPSNSQTLLCVPARKTVAQASRLFFQNQKTTGKLIYAALDVILEPVASVYDRRTKPSRGTRPPHRAKRKETSKGRRPTLHAHIDLIAGLSFLYSVAVSAPHKQATIPDRGSKAKNILWHLRPINPPSSASAFLGDLCALAVKNSSIAIFGTLDEKIELNRRMNATLEAMARALFQSWFVDFDPVRRNAEGATPRPEDSLFPDSFEDSAKEEIPKGWKHQRWGDIVTLEYGKSLRDYRESTGKYRVYGTNGPIGFNDRTLCASDGIVIGRKGAYRGVHYSPEPFFVIDTAFYVKPKQPINLKWAYYELLRFDINGMDSGFSFQCISRDDFYGIQVVTPPTEVQEAFCEIVSLWFAKMQANDAETRNLGNLRDALLPQLLGGMCLALQRKLNKPWQQRKESEGCIQSPRNWWGSHENQRLLRCRSSIIR